MLFIAEPFQRAKPQKNEVAIKRSNVKKEKGALVWVLVCREDSRLQYYKWVVFTNTVLYTADSQLQ